MEVCVAGQLVSSSEVFPECPVQIWDSVSVLWADAVLAAGRTVTHGDMTCALRSLQPGLPHGSRGARVTPSGPRGERRGRRRPGRERKPPPAHSGGSTAGGTYM